MKRESPILPLRVGLIGCGNVSDTYFKHATAFSNYFEIAACASRTLGNAEAKASEYGISKACTVQELLKDPRIDAVLNLTNPAAHTEVNLQALRAGKHVYCEKPFAISYRDGVKVLREAAKRKLRVGCAPDTILGSGFQTCRKLIDEGAIGKPIGATANFQNHGSEHWHPNPNFFYQWGGGPLLGAGPYYLGALITMLGPAKSVSASATQGFKERLITSQSLRGKKIEVNIPTHLVGIVEFAHQAIASVTMSFDTWAHHAPLVEIYGTEGSLQCPDPNTFAGDVLIYTQKAPEWQKAPLTHQKELGRGLGLAEMAQAMCQRRPHRASAELALHVVEIIEAFHVSAKQRKQIALKSSCTRLPALPFGLIDRVP